MSINICYRLIRRTILGVILTAAVLISAQQISVSSVRVDEVWNSDTAGRTSRNCRISFLPEGNMKMVRWSLLISFDNGQSFVDSIEPYKDWGVDSFAECGIRMEVNAHIPGGDRQNVVVKVFTRVPMPAMVSIPGGTFQMGSNHLDQWGNPTDESPIHSVTLSPFNMGTIAVTQELLRSVMGYFAGDYGFGGIYDPPAEVYPVCGSGAYWGGAILFCNSLSKITGKDTVYTHKGYGDESWKLLGVNCDLTKNGYRLPTEAEYEYACRAGTTTDYYWGRNWPPSTREDTLAMDSNAVVNITGIHQNGTFRAGATKKANPWGLFDMVGNFWELTNDTYAPYTAAPQTDPSNAFHGDIDTTSWFAARGSCAKHSSLEVHRSSMRRAFWPAYGAGTFRVVCRP